MLVFLGFLLLGGSLGARGLRREHWRLVLLRHEVERDVAPGEPVVVDNWWLYQALRWKSSPMVREQIQHGRAEGIPASLPGPGVEVMLVTTADDALLATLRSEGFRVTEDVSRSSWLEGKDEFAMPGGGLVRIYFVTAGMEGGAR